MTTIARKPVHRETLTRVRFRSKSLPLIITLEGYTLTMRPKGLRVHTSALTVDIDAVWSMAVHRRAAQILAEKAAKRKAKKDAR